MLDKKTIFEIHRLADQGVSIKKISEILVKDRKTVRKYLNDPQLTRKPANKKSKLDPFKNEIDRLLTINAGASAVVIQQRLAEKGYDGGLSILKNHLKKVRGTRKRRAYIRFESEPGHQCQIDWGHFGSLDYDGDRRKLYCLAIIESHSRMLYVEFTHSQNQADQWQDDVANVRLHATTGQRPIERIMPEALRPLPDLLPDCRETKSLKIFASKLFNTVNKVFNLAECQYFMDVTDVLSVSSLFFYFARCQRKIQETGAGRHRPLCRRSNGTNYHGPFEASDLRLPGLTTGCIPPIFIPDVVLLYKKR